MLIFLLLLLQDKPEREVKEAIKKLLDSEGARIHYTVETAYHKIDAAGILKKSFCGLKGPGQITSRMPYLQNQYGDKNELEFYASQDKYLVTIHNDKFKAGWVEPAALGGEDGVVTATLRNPWVMLGELEWGLPNAKLDGGVYECPITNADQKIEVLRRLVGNHRDGRKGANPGALKSVLDVKATIVAYKIWIADGRIQKIEKKIKIELKPEIRQLLQTVGKAGAFDVPVLDVFSGLWTVEFLGNPDGSWGVPKAVRDKLGLQ
jgi:hypothetical protein